MDAVFTPNDLLSWISRPPGPSKGENFSNDSSLWAFVGRFLLWNGSFAFLFGKVVETPS